MSALVKLAMAKGHSRPVIGSFRLQYDSHWPVACLHRPIPGIDPMAICSFERVFEDKKERFATIGPFSVQQQKQQHLSLLL